MIRCDICTALMELYKRKKRISIYKNIKYCTDHYKCTVCDYRKTNYSGSRFNYIDHTSLALMDVIKMYHEEELKQLWKGN